MNKFNTKYFLILLAGFLLVQPGFLVLAYGYDYTSSVPSSSYGYDYTTAVPASSSTSYGYGYDYTSSISASSSLYDYGYDYTTSVAASSYYPASYTYGYDYTTSVPSSCGSGSCLTYTMYDYFYTPTPVYYAAPTYTLYDYFYSEEEEDLNVHLTASPSSGCASLNNVDLTASVSGGDPDEDITYYFDCTNDGDWERVTTESSTHYTASNLCDYDSDDNYTARVKVIRNGETAQDTTQIDVDSCDEDEDEEDLDVSLSASPSSGCASLNNVDLKAKVSGGDPDEDDITYYFDCTNDGDWEKTTTQDSKSYTAKDLCDYDSDRTYTARVKVKRGGETAQDTTKIDVDSCNNEALAVDIKANGSDSYTTISYDSSATLSWTSDNADHCYASGNWSGSKSTSGSQSTGNLTSSKTYTITCTGSDGSETDSVTVYVPLKAVAGAVAGAVTEVVTGANFFYLSLIIALLLSIVFWFLLPYLENTKNPFIRKILGVYYKIKLFVLR